MIPLAPVIAALKANGTPFKFVGGAADLMAATEDLKNFPSAYVLPLADRASGNQAGANATVQDLTERFGVMYAIRNVRTGSGDKAQEDLRVAIDWARTQLVGLTITGARDTVNLEGGDFVSFDSSILIWTDTYLTSSQLRKA